MSIIAFLYILIYQLPSLQNYCDIDKQFNPKRIYNFIFKNELIFEKHLDGYNGVKDRTIIGSFINNFRFEKTKDLLKSYYYYRYKYDTNSYNDYQLKHLKVIGNQ